MDHDYAHCADFKDDCPKRCFRAQLVRDLKPGDVVSWMHFKGTEECRKGADCRFCEAYELNKRVSSFKAARPELYGGYHWKSEITVAIVVHDWTKEQGKKNAGRTTDYRYRGLGYKLNYCPECGRKLK